MKQNKKLKHYWLTKQLLKPVIPLIVLLFFLLTIAGGALGLYFALKPKTLSEQEILAKINKTQISSTSGQLSYTSFDNYYRDINKEVSDKTMSSDNESPAHFYDPTPENLELFKNAFVFDLAKDLYPQLLTYHDWKEEKMLETFRDFFTEKGLTDIVIKQENKWIFNADSFNKAYNLQDHPLAALHDAPNVYYDINKYFETNSKVKVYFKNGSKTLPLPSFSQSDNYHIPLTIADLTNNLYGFYNHDKIVKLWQDDYFANAETTQLWYDDLNKISKDNLEELSTLFPTYKIIKNRITYYDNLDFWNDYWTTHTNEYKNPLPTFNWDQDVWAQDYTLSTHYQSLDGAVLNINNPEYYKNFKGDVEYQDQQETHPMAFEIDSEKSIKENIQGLYNYALKSWAKRFSLMKNFLLREDYKTLWTNLNSNWQELPVPIPDLTIQLTQYTPFSNGVIRFNIHDNINTHELTYINPLYIITDSLLSIYQFPASYNDVRNTWEKYFAGSAATDYWFGELKKLNKGQINELLNILKVRYFTPDKFATPNNKPVYNISLVEMWNDMVTDPKTFMIREPNTPVFLNPFLN